MTRSSIVVLIFSLLTTVSGFAAAQQDDEEPATQSAMKQAAKELYDAAREARKVDDFATCHAKASAAWAIHAHPSVAALIGDCAVGIKNYRDAAERLTFFFSSPDAQGSDSLRAHLRSRLDQALSRVATVKLSASVPDAICDVDGQRIDHTPKTIFLDPGEHVFEAQHSLHTTTSRRETLLAGSENTIVLELVPVPALLDPDKPTGNDRTGLIVGASLSGVVAAGGLALLIASAVLHGAATSDIETLNNTIDNQSPGDSACGNGGGALASSCADLDSAISDQKTFATLFPVGAIIAGVGVAGTATFLALYFAGASDTEVSMKFSPTSVNMTVEF